jgi:hypothetical protein
MSVLAHQQQPAAAGSSQQDPITFPQEADEAAPIINEPLLLAVGGGTSQQDPILFTEDETELREQTVARRERIYDPLIVANPPLRARALFEVQTHRSAANAFIGAYHRSPAIACYETEGLIMTAANLVKTHNNLPRIVDPYYADVAYVIYKVLTNAITDTETSSEDEASASASANAPASANNDKAGCETEDFDQVTYDRGILEAKAKARASVDNATGNRHYSALSAEARASASSAEARVSASSGDKASSGASASGADKANEAITEGSGSSRDKAEAQAIFRGMVDFGQSALAEAGTSASDYSDEVDENMKLRVTIATALDVPISQSLILRNAAQRYLQNNHNIVTAYLKSYEQRPLTTRVPCNGDICTQAEKFITDPANNQSIKKLCAVEARNYTMYKALHNAVLAELQACIQGVMTSANEAGGDEASASSGGKASASSGDKASASSGDEAMTEDEDDDNDEDYSPSDDSSGDDDKDYSPSKSSSNDKAKHARINKTLIRCSIIASGVRKNPNAKLLDIYPWAPCNDVKLTTQASNWAATDLPACNQYLANYIASRKIAHIVDPAVIREATDFIQPNLARVDKPHNKHYHLAAFVATRDAVNKLEQPAGAGAGAKTFDEQCADYSKRQLSVPAAAEVIYHLPPSSASCCQLPMLDLAEEVSHHLPPSSALTNYCQLPMPDAPASPKRPADTATATASPSSKKPKNA